jgi:hypothetical protein
MPSLVYTFREWVFNRLWAVVCLDVEYWSRPSVGVTDDYLGSLVGMLGDGPDSFGVGDLGAADAVGDGQSRRSR